MNPLIPGAKPAPGITLDGIGCSSHASGGGSFGLVARRSWPRRLGSTELCHDLWVAMREDCRFYESRTYPSGEVARKCDLDLAPDAPWDCPKDCPAFERRVILPNWVEGSLVAQPAPEAPVELGADVAALLDEAENIVNSAAPEILADLDRGRRRSGPIAKVGGWIRRRRRDA